MSRTINSNRHFVQGRNVQYNSNLSPDAGFEGSYYGSMYQEPMSQGFHRTMTVLPRADMSKGRSLFPMFFNSWIQGASRQSQDPMSDRVYHNQLHPSSMFVDNMDNTPAMRGESMYCQCDVRHARGL